MAMPLTCSVSGESSELCPDGSLTQRGFLGQQRSSTSRNCTLHKMLWEVSVKTSRKWENLYGFITQRNLCCYSQHFYFW